jgi:hypothetical protein
MEYNEPSGKRQMLRKFALALATGSLLLAASAGAGPLVTLTGEIAGGTTTLDLSTYSTTSVTVGSDTYTGVALWQLLGGSGTGTSNASNVINNVQPPLGSTNNAMLRSYLTVTNAAGQSETITVGEINSFFGGGQFGGAAPPSPLPVQAPPAPYIVATQKNGIDIAPALIVPKDTTGTRWLADLATISVSSVHGPLSLGGGQSTSFLLTGVDNPQTFNLAQLQLFDPTPTTQTVTFYAGSTAQSHTYKGVTVWELLTAAGISDADLLRDAVLFTGTDGFQVMVSLAELDPALNPGRDVGLIAYAETVGGVDQGLGGSGFARLVMSGDFHGGRYVSNLARIELIDVPEPRMAFILVAALTLIGGAMARRSRTS